FSRDWSSDVCSSDLPGNHGHHQMAARFAVAAYDVAGDPTVFPEQIENEGLPAWAPAKIFTRPFFQNTPTGESCATEFVPTDPTEIGRAPCRERGRLW